MGLSLRHTRNVTEENVSRIKSDPKYHGQQKLIIYRTGVPKQVQKSYSCAEITLQGVTISVIQIQAHYSCHLTYIRGPIQM